MTTIKEIADMAGVSRGTVDRVLNNRGLVRDETAERIRQIASALDYRPNRAGKILVNRKKALNVALILFRGENPFFADVLSGAKAKAEELQDMGITVSFYDTSIDNPEEQIRLLLDLEEKGVNGIALTPICDSRVAQTISEISARGIPIVTINTDIENSGRIAFVGSDHQVGRALSQRPGQFGFWRQCKSGYYKRLCQCAVPYPARFRLCGKLPAAISRVKSACPV